MRDNETCRINILLELLYSGGRRGFMGGKGLPDSAPLRISRSSDSPAENRNAHGGQNRWLCFDIDEAENSNDGLIAIDKELRFRFSHCSVRH